MSGGSFNYLGNVYDLDDLSKHIHDLDDMARALSELGYADDAASETTSLLLSLRAFEVRARVQIERLRPIWHAMEWWKSCDTNEATFKESLEKYRSKS